MNSQREKRSKGSVPFGYDLDPEDSSYVMPNQEQLDVLQNVEESIVIGSISLRDGSAWLKYKTGRDISHKGLQKKIIKKYGRSDSEERVAHRSRLISDRFK